ncbi:biotin transporter BioY [Streptomyces cinnamoneus]|uniref:Biotin transporter BioY n=1 Tax=Streptomyces cinnamoneus TaxID=53446 RepID=A0A2G1X9Q5_STRCJ|nr:ATP-binding protein [Streptomyces cinnamoneus]PHQ47945.1 biotin transporter BioY [Streptomyces cinnamoneus]PPT15569.1 biotin transporter BioY [Streptomyces cinnamoneus]
MDAARQPQRPAVTELRLSAFKSHRNAVYPLAPLTLFRGASGSGKSSALEAYGALARLAGGDRLDEALAPVAGGALACVPQSARPDAQGRRGFRIGCTVEGPVGPVRLDVAVQAEPELRVVGERLSASGRVLLSTALRDPGLRKVEAAWHTAGSVPVTRAPLPDDRLGTALLPLRVAGKTAGQRMVLDAAEQTVVALRSVFPCDPRPELMRTPVAARDGLLRGACDNVAAVLGRTRNECVTRHAALVAAAGAGCRGQVEGLGVEGLTGGLVRAVLARGPGADTPLERLGDGELRYLALCLVLLTGPGVLEVDPAAEVLPARQVLTVLADGFDRCLDGRQARELLGLAARMCERGHIRLVGSVRGVVAEVAEEVMGASMVDLEV